MSDPFFDSNIALLHFDGADGSTVIDDVMGNTWAVVGDAQLDTDEAKFGPSSLLLDGNGDYISLPHGAVDFSGDEFNFETFFMRGGTGTSETLFSNEDGGVGGISFYIDTANKLRGYGYLNGGGTAFNLFGTTVLTVDSLWHWVVLRLTTAGNWEILLDGVVEASAASGGSVGNPTSSPFYVGHAAPFAGDFIGHLDEMRIGTADRYGTAPLTVPTEPFPDEGVPLAPAIDTQPQPQTVTEGNNAVYTVAATTSGGTLLYQWYETTAGLLGGETTDTLTITTVLGDNGNGYYVTVTDDNDTVTSDTAALTVNAVGTISTLFDDSKGFPSEEYENAIDRITFMMQELEGSLCDCRYIDPETGLPPVVTCVPLLSSTGIYNTELQGGGEATPIEGETLTLGVSVSGTGPYTYQWKVDAVDVVGATSLTFDYVVTAANVSITVQVTNACSTILVGPYLVEFCVGYDCDALAETGQVSAEAYWPMTDPMVPAPGVSRYFHAGETYGPYTDGGGGLGLYRLSGDVHPVIVQNRATITFADFNYCEDEVVGTYDHWIDTNLSNFGHELRQGGVTVRPNFSFAGSASHILVGNVNFTDFYAQGRFSFVFDEGDPQERDNDSTQMWTRVNMGGSDVTVSLQRGSGTSPSTTVAHDIDTTKPYVVTTTLGNTWIAGDNPTSTANSETSISQPGATTVSISLVNIQTYGEINVRSIINGVSGSATINLGVSGGSTSWLGIAYGTAAHGQILDGLARNYEDYVCP